MTRFTRRTTLKLAAGGAALLAVGAACQTDSTAPKVDEVRIEPAELPPDGNPFHSEDGRFFLFQNEREPIALYARCTHRSCLIGWQDEDGEFRCPCHGSRFDRSGAVLAGPAERPLERMAVEQLEDGALVVHTDERFTGER
jgi:cytochrome b6-f complex iron-sulfur subunit